MSSGATNITPSILAFVEQAKRDTAKVAKILWESRTLSASRTFQAYTRVPGEDLFVATAFPDFWEDGEVKASLAGFDGTTYLGKPQGTPGRYTRIFQKHPRINTVIHAHTVALGSWASAHKPFPIRYVPITRETVATEFPVYVDRRQQEQDFIVARLDENPHIEAVVEANGGSTFFGDGIVNVSRRIVLIEEGALFQLNAQALGGSRLYGPGVLEQQWNMGLVPRDLADAALASARAGEPS